MGFIITKSRSRPFVKCQIKYSQYSLHWFFYIYKTCTEVKTSTYHMGQHFIEIFPENSWNSIPEAFLWSLLAVYFGSYFSLFPCLVSLIRHICWTKKYLDLTARALDFTWYIFRRDSVCNNVITVLLFCVECLRFYVCIDFGMVYQ